MASPKVAGSGSRKRLAVVGGAVIGAVNKANIMLTCRWYAYLWGIRLGSMPAPSESLEVEGWGWGWGMM